ncbi:MAG: PDZ domain-containing protein [Candidatus Aminicenantales bacterium]
MSKKLRTLSMTMAALFVFALGARAEIAGGAPEDKDISGITKRSYPSVVRIEARNSVRKVASGVVIDNDGHILTTALISPRDETITVITGEGKRIEAEFLGFDSETHLALVRAKEKGLAPLPMAEKGTLGPGAWICVVSISPEMTPAVTQGIVSSVSDERMRLNIWVTPGTSGSPVVDENGRMVGLLRGVYTEDSPVMFEFRGQEQAGSGFVLSRGEAPSSGMAMAIPIEVVKRVAGEIREKGRVERGWIGLTIAQNDEGSIEVIGIEPESPAEQAKIEEGDVILAFGGKELTNSQALAAEIRGRKPGEDVALKIERAGKPMDIKVKLGVYPEEQARRDLELRFPRLFPQPVPGAPKGAVPNAPRFRTRPGRPGLAWESRTYIGVYLEELNRDLSQYFGVPEGTGLLVNKLTEGGPADKAGVKVGDVIVKASGKRVETVNELSGVVQDGKKGDKIKLEVLRDKKSRVIEVVIAQDESEPFLDNEGLGEDLAQLAEKGRLAAREIVLGIKRKAAKL